MPKPKVRKFQKPAEDYPETVQIDVNDPIRERTTEDGKRRLALNDREIQLINESKLIEQALILFVEKGMTIPEVAAELDIAKGKLVATINSDEYPEFRKAAMRRAVEMFLDLEQSRTRKEIEDELGLTPNQFRAITLAPEFAELYNSMFLEMRAHPGIQAVQAKLLDYLLPQSFQVMSEALTKAGVPWSVKLKAALEVWRMAGIKPVDSVANDRNEMAEFLANKGIQINNFFVAPPPEYQAALEKYAVVEGEVEEIEEQPPGGGTPGIPARKT